jgi:FAD/FMN-containing dehydrogenase
MTAPTDKKRSGRRPSCRLSRGSLSPPVVSVRRKAAGGTATDGTAGMELPTGTTREHRGVTGTDVLHRRLAEVVGSRFVVTDPEIVGPATIDWTGRFRGRTPMLVRPGSVSEVAGIVTSCRELGAPLCLQGGNTGLVGGGVPLAGEILVSMLRLRNMEVEPTSGQAWAAAGCTIGALQAEAAGHGWCYGVDLGSRDSATVGGTVATNAGGLRMLRYGDTRAQLVGIEAVLGDGSVISHMSGLLKDNTGYHWPSLLCGSEGTLGVVTATRLRLVPPLRERAVALLGFAGIGEAVGATSVLRRLPSVEAIELMLSAGVELVCQASGAPFPLSGDCLALVLVEVAAAHDPTPELSDGLDALTGVVDSAVALDPARRSALWSYREGHTEAVNALGAPHKLDVTLPADRLAAFIEEVPRVVARVAPGARTYQWGHAGDGNVHVNVVGIDRDDERVDDAVLRMAADAGGSISAEHGIGTAKRRWLSLSRSQAEIGAFRAVKRALDPDGVLNPSVLFP